VFNNISVISWQLNYYEHLGQTEMPLFDAYISRSYGTIVTVTKKTAKNG